MQLRENAIDQITKISRSALPISHGMSQKLRLYLFVEIYYYIYITILPSYDECACNEIS